MKVRRVGLFVGFLLGGIVLLYHPFSSMSQGANVVLATTLVMATWWMTEALPIYATSLLPLVAFPFLGVRAADKVSVNYMDPNIVLFMGGFFLAMAIQKWDLHRRIALSIIVFLGDNCRRLILGFMVATAFLSMWISNTATAVMMFPIGTAVVYELEDQDFEAGRLPVVLLLSIAYGASIGGVATIIGTPPNLVLAAQYAKLFPEMPPITFAKWMILGVPFSTTFLLIAWFYLTRIYSDIPSTPAGSTRSMIRDKLTDLGAMSPAEKRITGVFVLTALAWIFREPIRIGAFTVPGWAPALGVEEFVHDATVAVASSLLLFLLPAGTSDEERLLDWDWAAKIPWGVLILFGGGLALADGFAKTGLSKWAGHRLMVLEGLPLIAIVLSLCLLTTFLTEVTSNTATTTIFMPVLAGAATSLAIEPEYVMIPAAISASCAFMLPVATPPNAIIFGSDHLTIPDMSRAGIWLNLIGVLVVTFFTYSLVGLMFGMTAS